jgi:hypothetical protein
LYIHLWRVIGCAVYACTGGHGCRRPPLPFSALLRRSSVYNTGMTCSYRVAMAKNGKWSGPMAAERGERHVNATLPCPTLPYPPLEHRSTSYICNGYSRRRDHHDHHHDLTTTRYPRRAHQASLPRRGAQYTVSN